MTLREYLKTHENINVIIGVCDDFSKLIFTAAIAICFENGKWAAIDYLSAHAIFKRLSYEVYHEHKNTLTIRTIYLREAENEN